MAAIASPNPPVSTKPPSISHPFQPRNTLLPRFALPIASNHRKRHRIHISNVLSDSKPTTAASTTTRPPLPAEPFVSRFAPDQPRKGFDVLVEALEREGVTDVFAYPGGASMEIHQALTRSPIIRYVLPRHEQGGVLAAEGYARASGLPGVCIATSGPGATNLVSGLADALLDSVPIVAISGQVVMSNGIVQVVIQNPEGHITGIQYQGIDNLLEVQKNESSRGYWDVVWSPPGSTRTEGTLESVTGTSCKVIKETKDQVEVSFFRTWDVSLEGKSVPLRIDKRYIMLSGSSGFYTYAIFEHVEGWPSFDLEATRIAFKLRKDKFHYMAMSDDNRQRDMPLPDDRLPKRSETLDYPEAVLLVDPVEPKFKGQVDDKYQYTCELKDLQVHGWICTDPAVGFWQITPSNEFRVGGPIKQELTSHVGPTTLSIFSSAHYGGNDMVIKFEKSESWKKVLGPIFIYLNSVSDGKSPYTLWNDAKHQMSIEVDSWPYDFPASPDFQSAGQRGAVRGRLLVHDTLINSHGYISANNAYVGLALPGAVGSWQRETKKYQFWTKANTRGYFTIKNIIAGEYNLYAWVPGFIGDFKNSKIINITSGVNINMGELVYHPPRSGPTLWAIGFPDRTAAEFHIPDPQPKYANKFLLQGPNRFRQYGLWNRYSDLYPHQDLVYTIGESDYRKDFFFAHVLRQTDDGIYKRTTWTIKFRLDHVNESGTYILRLALASAHQSKLLVRINDMNSDPLFSTGFFGGDNAIARHGIHGLYWLFSIKIPGSHLYSHGLNSIYLTQANNMAHFQGVMYDYIRLEGPRTSIVNKIS